MERFREAAEVVALLRRLISERGSRLVQHKQLRSDLQKLEAEIKGGSKASRSRVTKLIASISKTVCAECLRK
jgi:hypothetical protein